LKRIFSRSKDVSFFWRLLTMTVFSGLISVVLLSILLVPNLLRVAEENDLAHEENMLQATDNCFDTLLGAVEDCLNSVEESEWLHDLYIDHVLSGISTQRLHRDLLRDLTLIANAQGGFVDQISFQFYQDPQVLYTSTGVFSNIAFFREEYPEEMQYFFPSLSPDDLGFKIEQFQGQDVLVYYTEFTDVAGGVPKGKMMLVIDQEHLRIQLQKATGGKVAFAEIADSDGNPLWSCQLAKAGEDLFYTEKFSDADTYRYRIGVTRSVHTLTSRNARYTIIFTLLIVAAICIAISLYLARANFAPVKILSEKYGLESEGKNELSVLETTIDQIVSQRSEDTAMLNRLRPLAQQRIIDGLLSGSVRLSNPSIDQIHYCDLLFRYTSYAVAAVSCSVTARPTPENDGEPVLGYTEVLMEDLLTETLAELPISAHLYFLDDNRYRILFNADSEELIRSAVEKINSSYRDILSRRGFDADLCFGVGSVVDSLENIYLSAEQGVTALNLAMAQSDDDGFVFFDEYAKQINMGYYYPLSAETLLLRAITESGAETAQSILDDIIETNRNRLFLSYNSHRLLYFNLCATIIRSAQSLGISLNIMPEAHYMKQAMSLSMIHAKVSRLIDEVCNNIAKVRNERSVSVEDEIVDYINQNLYDPGMSLSQVADRFQKSSAYVSTVFKNVTGSNYSDYVNQSRIIRATELLSQGDMSIEEVCHAVGYVSLSTFRRNFNKYTKTNPGEYITEKRGGYLKQDEE